MDLSSDINIYKYLIKEKLLVVWFELFGYDIKILTWKILLVVWLRSNNLKNIISCMIWVVWFRSNHLYKITN
jgi:hypothetical protein